MYTWFYIGAVIFGLCSLTTVGAIVTTIIFWKDDDFDVSCGIGAAFVLGLATIFSGALTFGCTIEVRTEFYKHITEWGDRHPACAEDANRLMADDGIIDNYEYSWLKEKARKLDFDRNQANSDRNKNIYKKKIKLDVEK